MESPYITSLYAGILAFMLLALSIFVIRGRLMHKVGLGNGGKQDMMQRMRMHGNFIEYVPMLLIMMAIMEINGLHVWMLHTYGIILVSARAIHAYGLYISPGTSLYRFIGAGGTFFLLLIGGIACIARYVS